MATTKTKQSKTGLDFTGLNKYEVCLMYGHMTGGVEEFLKECDDKGFISWVERVIADGEGSFKAGLEKIAAKHPTTERISYEGSKSIVTVVESVWVQMLEGAVDAPSCEI